MTVTHLLQQIFHFVVPQHTTIFGSNSYLTNFQISISITIFHTMLNPTYFTTILFTPLRISSSSSATTTFLLLYPFTTFFARTNHKKLHKLPTFNDTVSSPPTTSNPTLQQTPINPNQTQTLQHRRFTLHHLTIQTNH
jgi:hypothetical protein